jgi:hypothetical protein
MSVANPKRVKASESARETTDIEVLTDESVSFTREDLRLIKAMCRSANPWWHESPMLPAFYSVYDKASDMLEEWDETPSSG